MADMAVSDASLSSKRAESYANFDETEFEAEK